MEYITKKKRKETYETMPTVCELIGNLFSEYTVLNVKCKYKDRPFKGS